MICIDLAKKAMTAAEGRRALGELRETLGQEHVREVEAKLDEAERGEPSPRS